MMTEVARLKIRENYESWLDFPEPAAFVAPPRFRRLARFGAWPFFGGIILTKNNHMFNKLKKMSIQIIFALCIICPFIIIKTPNKKFIKSMIVHHQVESLGRMPNHHYEYVPLITKFEMKYHELMVNMYKFIDNNIGEEPAAHKIGTK